MKLLASLVLVVSVGCGKKDPEPKIDKPADKPAAKPADKPAPAVTPAPAASHPSPGGTLANAVGAAIALPCDKAARDVQGSAASSWFMTCPACNDHPGNVWGTDIYTDDSNLCAAAIHAGAIQPSGGTFLVTWAAPQHTYVGSERNGIATSDYGKWQRSFVVQSVDASGAPTSIAPVPPPEGTVRLSCKMTAETVDLPAFHGICPPGCLEANVWGTDVYTADSAVCVAAVHAGVATADKGGDVRVKRGGAQDKFAASERNGVQSIDYGQYGTTFTFEK